MLKYTHTDKAPAAVGPYSQGVSANGMLFISGQVGINPALGALEGSTIVQQAEQACKNVGEILREAGLGFEDVVKTTCFLADIGDFAAFNEIYAKYFTSKPARSCVAVKDLPKGALCEIEVIAAEK
jgi:reactive intermediate/imine deaminase